MKNSIQDILSFWFEEASPVQWFQISSSFDHLVIDKFLGLYRFAQGGYCDDWAQSADGAMALVLLYDQFPRNMFRNTWEAYQTDDRACRIARLAITAGFPVLFPPHQRRFFYLPFEHSEDLNDQKYAVTLFSTMKDEEPLAYDYAVRHYQVIEKFGRFPHRNAILGRISTADEIEYLKRMAPK